MVQFAFEMHSCTRCQALLDPLDATAEREKLDRGLAARKDLRLTCTAGVRRVAGDSGVDVVTMADMLVAGLQPEASVPGFPFRAKSADPAPCPPVLFNPS